MACCLLCFDSSPLPDDPKANRAGQFQITMSDAITKGQPMCCLTYCCPCCSNIYIRYKVLDGDLTRYTCCQGYADGPCFQSGHCGEKSCPLCCLTVESFCCLGISMSSSRIYLMDLYDLRPDPCDNQIIRLSNCLQCFACILDIIAIFFPCLQDAASIVQTIANCVFYTTIGCMAGQISYEVDYRLGLHVPYDDIVTPILGDGIVIKAEEEPYQSKP